MDGRAKNGGARNGAGRKRKDTEADLSTMLDKCITPDDWQQMFGVLYAKACASDIGAAKLLMSYRFGMPVQRQEITGEDGNAITIKLEYADIDPPAPA